MTQMLQAEPHKAPTGHDKRVPLPRCAYTHILAHTQNRAHQLLQQIKFPIIQLQFNITQTTYQLTMLSRPAFKVAVGASGAWPGATEVVIVCALV